MSRSPSLPCTVSRDSSERDNCMTPLTIRSVICHLFTSFFIKMGQSEFYPSLLVLLLGSIKFPLEVVKQTWLRLLHGGYYMEDVAQLLFCLQNLPVGLLSAALSLISFA